MHVSSPFARSLPFIFLTDSEIFQKIYFKNTISLLFIIIKVKDNLKLLNQQLATFNRKKKKSGSQHDWIGENALATTIVSQTRNKRGREIDRCMRGQRTTTVVLRLIVCKLYDAVELEENAGRLVLFDRYRLSF